MLKREIFEKAKELAKTTCPTRFQLCQIKNNQECYCTAGLVLKAAGYKPILKGYHGVGVHGLVNWWRSPSHHRLYADRMAEKFQELVKNEDHPNDDIYGKVYTANDGAMELDDIFTAGLNALAPYVEK